MSLPKWVDENRNDIGYIDRLEKALAVAVEALENLSKGNRATGVLLIARNALAQIEKTGENNPAPWREKVDEVMDKEIDRL